MQQTIGSIINEGKRIQDFFLGTVQMFFPLFFERALVEIKEIKCDGLVGIRRDELPLLVVFSKPGLSNINRSIFAFYRQPTGSESMFSPLLNMLSSSSNRFARAIS